VEIREMGKERMRKRRARRRWTGFEAGKITDLEGINASLAGSCAIAQCFALCKAYPNLGLHVPPLPHYCLRMVHDDVGAVHSERALVASQLFAHQAIQLHPLVSVPGHLAEGRRSVLGPGGGVR